MDPMLIVAMLAVSAGLVVYSIVAGRAQGRELLQLRLIDPRNKPAPALVASGVPTPAEKWLTQEAAPALAKLIRPKSAGGQVRLRVKLANAGFRRESAFALFLAVKIVLALGLLVLTLLAAVSAGHSPANTFGLAALGLGAGFLLPDLWLYLTARARVERINHGLPDCLDLLVICVEAGLGLDAALRRVSQEMTGIHPELAEEFILANLETQMGIARSEALANLGTRTGSSEVKSLTALLIQAERFGTSIAHVLRIHADSLRIKRRQAAEERAAKTTVKLILPLVLFIFPAILVVLTGPAVLKLWDMFASDHFG